MSTWPCLPSDDREWAGWSSLFTEGTVETPLAMDNMHGYNPERGSQVME
jgi:hypothetical protein